MGDFQQFEPDFYQSGYYIDDRNEQPAYIYEDAAHQDIDYDAPPPGFFTPSTDLGSPDLLYADHLFQPAEDSGSGAYSGADTFEEEPPLLEEDSDRFKPLERSGWQHHAGDGFDGTDPVLRRSGCDSAHGREDPFWLRVWHQCHGLPGHVLAAEPDEPGGRVLRLRGQRPRLLPPPHGGPLHLRHLLLPPGDSGNPLRRPGHRLVQPVCVQDLHLHAGDGRAAAPGGVPLRPALRRLRPAHCLLRPPPSVPFHSVACSLHRCLLSLLCTTGTEQMLLSRPAVAQWGTGLATVRSRFKSGMEHCRCTLEQGT